MMELSAQSLSPSAVPAAQLAIDTGHLSRMTLGDQSLAREVLELFDRQAAMLIARMRESSVPAVVSACAHTLKGSARGIGAFAVASAAEAVELTAGGSGSLEGDLARLAQAISEAKTAIAGLLRAH
ncbi:MAG TPA: Hpt domain-containing protein [Pseudolabrys sp.]|nr:Hpt domain-containing protein [Pseudolabrys sp.]